MEKGKSILYSSGNLAASLTASAFSTYITYFYVDVLKMPPSMIGLGMGIYGIWNAINDPLLGQISDRTRSRWGRRIPYILFGSIPFAIAFILVWMPPLKLIGNSIALMFAYFMTMIFLYDGFYTLVIINWTSLFPEMYKTQEERTRVSGYRQVIGIVANMIGVALPPILYKYIGWAAMGISFGLLSLLSLGLSLLGSKEDPAYSEGGGLSLIQSLKATFSNKSFLAYVIGAMFLQFTFVMLEAGMPFYAKYVLKVEGIKVSILLAAIFIVAIFFVGMWGKLANKKGSKYTIILSSIVYGLALIPFWFIKTFLWAVITAGLVGVGLAGLMILLDVMISDIVDEDELKTGSRREGMYFGINGFMVRLGISVQSVLMGFVLTVSGYNSKVSVDAQPASALAGIRSLLTIVPVVSLIFAVLFFRMYPLYGKRLEEVKSKVARLHKRDGGIAAPEEYVQSFK